MALLVAPKPDNPNFQTPIGAYLSPPKDRVKPFWAELRVEERPPQPPGAPETLSTTPPKGSGCKGLNPQPLNPKPRAQGARILAVSIPTKRQAPDKVPKFLQGSWLLDTAGITVRLLVVAVVRAAESSVSMV